MENFFKIARIKIKTQITGIVGLVTPRIKKCQTIFIRKNTTFTNLQAGEFETFRRSHMSPTCQQVGQLKIFYPLGWHQSFLYLEFLIDLRRKILSQ